MSRPRPGKFLFEDPRGQVQGSRLCLLEVQGILWREWSYRASVSVTAVAVESLPSDCRRTAAAATWRCCTALTTDSRSFLQHSTSCTTSTTTNWFEENTNRLAARTRFIALISYSSPPPKQPPTPPRPPPAFNGSFSCEPGLAASSFGLVPHLSTKRNFGDNWHRFYGQCRLVV